MTTVSEKAMIGKKRNVNTIPNKMFALPIVIYTSQ